MWPSRPASVGRKAQRRDSPQSGPLFFCSVSAATFLLPSSFILLPSSFFLHPSSFILLPSSFILLPSSFFLHPSSFT
jgi:hypothetical protein